MKRFRFQVKNGYIADGFNELKIVDHIAEVSEVTPSMARLIEAHGGVEEKAPAPKTKTTKKAEVKE